MLPVQKIFTALVLLVGAFLWGRASIPTVTPPEYVAINECPTGMGKINPTGVIECSPGSGICSVGNYWQPWCKGVLESLGTITVQTKNNMRILPYVTPGPNNKGAKCQNITDRKVQTYDCYTGESIGKPRDFNDDVCNIQWSDGTAEVPCDSGLSAELITN